MGSIRLTLSRLRRRIWYFGRRHECLLCSSPLRCFLPFGEDLPVLRELEVVGAGYRTQGLCPVCFCSDRERLLMYFLREGTGLLSDKRACVLHIAPERQLESVLRSQPQLTYVTGDLKADGVAVRLDVRRLPFVTRAFDCIICNHVLEHVVEDREAMQSLRRVLKPGGWAVLQVPISPRLERTRESLEVTSPEDRRVTFGQHDHVRIYGRDYAARLAQSGFAVRVIPLPEVVGQLADRYGLCPREEVFLCTVEEQTIRSEPGELMARAGPHRTEPCES